MMTYTFILKGIEKMDFPKKITKRPEDLIRKLCRYKTAQREQQSKMEAKNSLIHHVQCVYSADKFLNLMMVDDLTNCVEETQVRLANQSSYLRLGSCNPVKRFN